ncbi:MAG TPA: hypothetical protein VLT17_08575 [Gemmatimonadales bacterium]|nr:hypothetical protein [Gemmatimonadales bacterium]
MLRIAGAALFVTAVLLGAAPALAQTEPTGELPVSLDRIREALLQAPPPSLLRGLNAQPSFRVEVTERRRTDELLATLKFDSGPSIPGGLYAHELEQTYWPSVQNPLMQPYSAFTQGELVQVMVTSILEKYFAGRLKNAISNAERRHAEAAAHQEVTRAIAEYCTAQPSGGAGIEICANPQVAR